MRETMAQRAFEALCATRFGGKGRWEFASLHGGASIRWSRAAWNGGQMMNSRMAMPVIAEQQQRCACKSRFRTMLA